MRNIDRPSVLKYLRHSASGNAPTVVGQTEKTATVARIVAVGNILLLCSFHSSLVRWASTANTRTDLLSVAKERQETVAMVTTEQRLYVR